VLLSIDGFFLAGRTGLSVLKKGKIVSPSQECVRCTFEKSAEEGEKWQVQKLSSKREENPKNPSSSRSEALKDSSDTKPGDAQASQKAALTLW